jgi:hypothetical protein
MGEFGKGVAHRVRCEGVGHRGLVRALHDALNRNESMYGALAGSAPHVCAPAHLSVAVVDRQHQLLEEPSREGLLQPAAPLDKGQQGPARHKLHDDVHIPLCEEDPPERDHVGVVEAAVVEDLGADVVAAHKGALLAGGGAGIGEKGWR